MVSIFLFFQLELLVTIYHLSVQVCLRTAWEQQLSPQSAVVIFGYFYKFLLCFWLFLSVARR